MNKRNLIKIAQTFMVEMVGLYIFFSYFLAFLRVWNQRAIIGYLVSMLLLFFASQAVAKRFSLKFIYLLIPFSAFALVLFNFHWVVALIFSSIAALCLEKHFFRLSQAFIPHLLLLLWIGQIVIYLFQTTLIRSLSMQNFWLWLLMVVIFYLGNFLLNVVSANSNKKATIINASFWLGVLVLLTTIIVMSYPYIIGALSWISSGILQWVVSTFRIDQLDIKPYLIEETTVLPETSLINDSSKSSEMIKVATQNPQIFFWLMQLIGLVLFLWLGKKIYQYFKKRGQINIQIFNEQVIQSESTGWIKRSTKERRTVPNSQIRKEYFKFEKWLAKNGIGRYDDETIQDWLKRTNLDQTFDKTIIEQYQRYRYSGQDLTANEFETFRQKIQQMKQVL